MDTPTDSGTGAAPLTAFELVELQDQLLEAATNLERLEGLLDGAVGQLIERFTAIDAQLQSAPADNAAGQAARRELAGAVTALQFQDMASQMLSHTVIRIRGVADFLGARIETGDDAVAAPATLLQTACPVAQREVDAGSIELF